MKGLLLALPLAACAAVPTADAAAAEPWGALGTEPFWNVEIADGRMTYDTPEGGFSVPAPEPRLTPTGRRYVTPRLVVDIRPGVCNDGMSDNLFADTVIVVADGRTLHGCGGRLVPEDTLAHSSWLIAEIDGEPVTGDEYDVEFTADRVSGRAGCNRFSGLYSRSGDRLTIGPLATTRMACPSDRMEHERRALRVLSVPVRITVDRERGGIVLTGNHGSLLLFRLA